MATFEAQVEALTGITINSSGTNPTEGELTQFLTDGVLDVTEKWLIGHPQDREAFMNETALQVAQGADIGGADIISVLRADGVTAGNFRPCRKISPSQQSQVTDKESLSYASEYHPVYMVSGSNVKVFPAPSDNSGKDSYKVIYVNNIPKDSNGNSLEYSDSGLGYFPADKVYLVVLYAAIKSINNNMAAIIADLASFSVTAVPPVVPTQSTSITAYEAPSTNVATGTIDEEIALMQDYIEDNEDVELAGAKRSELEIRLKRNLDVFNSNIAKYQAEYQGETGYYNAEVQAYSAEVNAEVTEQTAKVQTESAKYQWLQDRAAALQAEYIAAFAIPQPQGGGR